MAPGPRTVSAVLAILLLGGCGGAGGRGPRPAATPAAQASAPRSAHAGAVTPTARAAGSRPAPRAASDGEQIRDLLARRATAMAAGDVTAYAATATGAQRVRDRVAARRAALLPLVRVALRAGSPRIHGNTARLHTSL